MQQLTKSFITKAEQATLLEWALTQRPKLKQNRMNDEDVGRFFNQLSELDRLPLLKTLADRIASKCGLIDAVQDTFFTDFLSFNEEGGAIPVHTDPNTPGYQHVRFNLLVQMPEVGGNAIYDGEEIALTERALWRVDAGSIPHGTTKVEGKKARINISFGFQIKDTK